ncbi:MAG: hypothetical protein KDJ99_33905 [Candidatus Competibacteraceae bacterium]|nr:hypothetical protein [Candidatus Competibacteraceae bacterium]
MANLWAEFQALFTQSPTWIGTVVQHIGSDYSNVQLINGGSLIRAKGQSIAIGQRCYVKDGEIIGPAPNILVVDIIV